MYSAPDRPLAISHRGLSSRAPENSIPAFEAAIEAGAEGIELDVHASRDGTLFVHHDAAVRAGNEPADSDVRLIAEADARNLSSVELAPGVTVPSLDAVLDAVRGRVDVFIEIKAPGIEIAVSRCLRRHADCMDRCAVHAFDHRVARRMLELVPPLRTGILQVSYAVDSCAMMRAAGASDLWQHADFIDTALVTSVRACGGRVIAWTANSPEQWDALARMGVHGICTDRVDDYMLHASNRAPESAGR